MAVMTVRDYANKHGITYQAVRKMVNKYMEDLRPNISVQNRTQYLNEEAQLYLDERRRTNPLVIVEEASTEEIDKLRREIENRELQIRELQSKIIELQEQKIGLVEYKAKTELLLEDKQKAEEELKATSGELTETKIKLSEAEKEAQSYHKTIFGLYKKS